MKRILTGVLLLAFGSVNWIHAQTAQDPPPPKAQSSNRRFEYAVKFVCGVAGPRASVTLPNGKTYYVVDGNDPAADTGNKVCAAVGKTCVGYTAKTNSICQQLHPSASVTSSVNGSNAGFYCDGPPQTGLACAANMNNCQICPTCNVNETCASNIGGLFREMYIECRPNSSAPDRLGAVVAPGQYFTAINVHNPNDRPAEFQKKVAVALPRERPGPISSFFNARLKADEALEIDCPDILQHAKAEGSLKGFVVIESDLELDVVAVYTAGHSQVETLDIERVPPRTITKAQIVPPPGPTALCPSGSSGAPVGNEGCCCNRPKPGGGSWPDCKAGLVCVGNAPGPGIPTSLYGVCTTHVSLNLFLDPPPPPNSSQPPFCGQR